MTFTGVLTFQAVQPRECPTRVTKHDGVEFKELNLFFFYKEVFSFMFVELNLVFDIDGVINSCGLMFADVSIFESVLS